MLKGMTIGLDLGGTHLRAGVYDGSEIIWSFSERLALSEALASLDKEQAETFLLDSLQASVKKAAQHASKIVAVGIAVPGFIDPRTHLLSESPNLPNIENIDIQSLLSLRLNCPVIIENDALTAAMGEYFRLEKSLESMVYIGLGTGVGGGFIYAGKVFQGVSGMAMEVGHITVEPYGRKCGCGQNGCLERYASATGVSLNYQDYTGQKLDAKEIAMKANQGELEALDSFSQAGFYLGMAVASIVKVIDNHVFIIGGGVSASWSLMQTSFQKALNEMLIPVSRENLKVIISDCNDQCGMLGAAVLAEQLI